MKKILLVLLVTLLILPVLVLPISAQDTTYSAEIWLNSDASGRGTFQLYVPPGGTDTIEDIYKEMVEGNTAVQVEPYRDLGNGSYEVDFSWNDFQAAFDQTVNVVGDTVEVDFGDTSFFVELIVHVPGQVLKTDGQVQGTDTVIFQQTATSKILFQTSGPLPTSTPPSPTPTQPSPTPTPTESPSDQLKIELRLENDGSGKGTVKGFLTTGITLKDIVSSLEESLTVIDSEQLGNRYTINIRWEDFNQAFSNAIRTENADGTISIAVSDLGINEITLILKGAIQDTTGQKQGSGTVVFRDATDGTVTYKPAGGPPSPTSTPPPTTPSTRPPGSTTPPPTPTPTASGEASKGLFSTFGTIEIIIVAGGALLLLVIIILIVILSSRRRRLPPPPPPVYPGTPPPIYTVPPPPPSSGTAQTTAAPHFCPQCGGPIQTGQRFCESCGKTLS